ncbi:MAG: DUF4125 family protein [Clostridiales bacterium]|jgi:hypothetical protein|nr:DUF4125 family protein [Clostridiales bacterium]
MERQQLIDSIVELEWDMFTNAPSAGGRAACQDDKPTFTVMRKAQAEIWQEKTLLSYKNDLEQAADSGVNLMTLKYAHMMKVTFPEEYEQLKDALPPVSQRATELADEIVRIHSKWSIKAAERYPRLISLGRPLTSDGNRYAAMDNYLHSELLTYSEQTLALCLNDTRKAEAEGINLSMEILKNTAASYGYHSIEALEQRLKSG